MSIDSKNPPLALSDIAYGMIACRKNGRELLEEGEILFAAGRFARSYFLMHTACEELAKFSVLELGGKRLARENPPIWKRFWQRFRSHDSKIAQLKTQFYYLVAGGVSLNERDAIDTALSLLDRGIVIRNSGLYVDTGPNGAFRKPSDISFDVPIPALRAAATLALRAADQRGDSISDLEMYLRKPPTDAEKENANKTMLAIFQHLRDEGINKEEVSKMVDKYIISK